jgi:hypothetical protein
MKIVASTGREDVAWSILSSIQMVNCLSASVSQP